MFGDGIPLWGEWGALGLSLSANVFVFISVIRGILVTRAQVDAVQKIADMWQKAYTDLQAAQKDNTLVWGELSVLTETFKHFLESLPDVEDKE